MRFLPLVVIVGAVALASATEGCTDRACLEWDQKTQGSCPAEHDAHDYFGACSDIKRVLSGPTFVDGDDLCCYDVSHYANEFEIPCSGSPTPQGSGGATRGTTSSSSMMSTTSTGGMGGGTGGVGGSSPACSACATALENGNDGSLCSGGALDAFASVLSCVCHASCASDCTDFCNVGDAPSQACSTCLDTDCAPAVATCNQN